MSRPNRDPLPSSGRPCFGQVSLAQDGVGQVDCSQIGPGKVSPAQVCARELRCREIGPPQIRPRDGMLPPVDIPIVRAVLKVFQLLRVRHSGSLLITRQTGPARYSDAGTASPYARLSPASSQSAEVAATPTANAR